MKRILCIVLAVLAAASCHETREVPDPALLETSSVCLRVKGKILFTYDENTCQMAWNADTHGFRAGDDEMASYFILRCAEQPREEGQEISADVSWKTDGSLRSRSKVTFQVAKTDLATGQVWLWAPSEQIGAVIRIF